MALTNNPRNVRPSEDKPTPADLDNRPAEDDKETWIVAKDANGEEQRIKTSEYHEWELEQEVKRAERR